MEADSPKHDLVRRIDPIGVPVSPSGSSLVPASDYAETTARRARDQADRCCHYGFGLPISELQWPDIPAQMSSLTGGGLPEYVQRTVDDQLRGALTRAVNATSTKERLVLLVGPVKSGKTRTLVEQLKQVLPHAALAWLRDPMKAEDDFPGAQLARLLGASEIIAFLKRRPLVIVVDDLDLVQSGTLQARDLRALA